MPKIKTPKPQFRLKFNIEELKRPAINQAAKQLVAEYSQNTKH